MQGREMAPAERPRARYRTLLYIMSSEAQGSRSPVLDSWAVVSKDLFVLMDSREKNFTQNAPIWVNAPNWVFLHIPPRRYISKSEPKGNAWRFLYLFDVS